MAGIAARLHGLDQELKGLVLSEPVPQLIAVSKQQPVEKIREALEAGQRLFGENRVQEAMQKWPELKAHYKGVELHLIGPLQRNKAKEAFALFDVIETVDRVALAEVLGALYYAAQGKGPALYVQVNVGKEQQKAGVMPEEAEGFIRHCREEKHLPVVGVMCIPPAGEAPERYFKELAALAGRCGLKAVSMGMSGDYHAAVRCGATHVRLGTAVFGEREY